MIIQILLRLLSTPKPTMNAQLFPSDSLDKMRLWKILRPDCCRRLILNHKSHYNILLRIQIDIRNAAEAVIMQKQREGAQVSVSRSGLWVGCRDDTQCYRQLCSSLHLPHPQRCDCCWADVQRRDIIRIISHFLTPRDPDVSVCQKWELQFSCPHPSQFQILSLNIFSRWFSWGKTGWDLQALADDGNPWPWLQTPS